MGHPIHKRDTVHLIPTKRGEPRLWLDGFASVVESQEFLQVGLHHCDDKLLIASKNCSVSDTPAACNSILMQ